MSKEKCNGQCCEHFFDDYDEDEDDYEIQRLKDIIKICEFLIQKRQHSKHKKEDLENFLREMTKEEKKKATTSPPPYRTWTYPYKNSRGYPWEIWF